jgi:Family of unknown function (DUF5762)
MSWFDKPDELFRADKVLKFWPNEKQSAEERINASTRFILYLACILYLLRRDLRILVLAMIAITVLFILSKTGSVRDTMENYNGKFEVCQRPTMYNPFGNVLLSDYTDRPNRHAACPYPAVEKDVKRYADDKVVYTNPPTLGRSRGFWPSSEKNASARQFISNPVTSIPGDQTAFAEWCYGKKFTPMCRDDPSQCNPDYWGVQPEAFSGLDFSGNKRSGMSGPH